MSEAPETVRVRFAPSPTGSLHVGGARTALFNWLFARHHGGTFVLRIEDTDVARSHQDYSRGIVDDLTWLGLHWDEGPGAGGPYGPYFQSERRELYRSYAERLLAEGNAYYCYCTAEELEARKRARRAEGMQVGYDGRCREISPSLRRRYEQEGRRPVVRFRADNREPVVVNDVLRGSVEFEPETLHDFILLKSDGSPTFNFANIIDDALMRITHVIRGDDHLSNTPRQLLLYRALGFEAPRFAHLPMILGSDGTRLSKRHGATSVKAYRDAGYLPQAMVNYLALLGWSTVDSQQLFEPDELVAKFSLDRVGASAATFDPEKLRWMCGEYIRSMDVSELQELVLPYLEEAFGAERVAAMGRDRLWRIVQLERERIRVLSDMPEQAWFFFDGDYAYDERATRKRLDKDYVEELLVEANRRIKKLEPFTHAALERELRSLGDEWELSASKVFHPVRVALTGRMTGPGLFDIAAVLGRDETIRRMNRTVRWLRERKSLSPAG